MPRKKVGIDQTKGVIFTFEQRQLIRREMRRRFWQQGDLALASGLSQMTISSALRGYAMWSRTEAAIWKAFDDNPAALSAERSA